MTANPIRRLLDAKPFVSFTLHLGSVMDLQVDDPKWCRLDDAEMLLYVSCPEVRPPAFVRHASAFQPATVEIIDLRHVTRVSVRSEAMPGED